MAPPEFEPGPYEGEALTIKGDCEAGIYSTPHRTWAKLGLSEEEWEALHEEMSRLHPRQDGGLVINVLRRIQAGEAPTIQGDGSQSFDFVHVADVARANIRAMESDVTDDAFNIGGGNEATVREIVERLIDLSGSDLEPDVQADVKVPMMRRVGSNEKAASLLEWKPSFDLEAGLQDVIGKG